MGPFPVLSCYPAIPDGNQFQGAVTHLHGWHLPSGHSPEDDARSHLHAREHNFGSICIRHNMNMSWSTGEVSGFQHNKKLSVMKAPPLVSFESTVVPLSPKVANTVKAIEKGL